MKPETIFRIDRFEMLEQAYYENSSGKNTIERLSFQSRNHYTFSLNGSRIRSVAEKTALIDTLRYHETSFIVYGGKSDYDRYQRSKTPFKIDVLQIQIGSKKYVDLPIANELERKRLMRLVLFQGGLILLLAFLFIKSYKLVQKRTLM